MVLALVGAKASGFLSSRLVRAPQWEPVSIEIKQSGVVVFVSLPLRTWKRPEPGWEPAPGAACSPTLDWQTTNLSCGNCCVRPQSITCSSNLSWHWAPLGALWWQCHLRRRWGTGNSPTKVSLLARLFHAREKKPALFPWCYWGGWVGRLRLLFFWCNFDLLFML